ncbi:MAG: exosortase/archaeosortase family protein [Desulfobacteraceae bacterium]|nr:exosortase/archaeosortase family protein [Desulfobacteraceae bacterium]MBC2749220.1 exosortase/archaeosortase family protein [Desulfobacteraceae bacterium]
MYIEKNKRPSLIFFQYATITLLFAGLFYDSLVELFQIWIDNSNNSHGMLVPFISFYLIWLKREKLNRNRFVGCNFGFVVIIFSLLFYVFGIVADIGFVRRLMIIGVIIGLVLFNGGKSLFKEIVFPLFFLVFMVPVPDSLILMISFPLQLFATKVSYFFIQTFGIPAYREGNMIYFATTQLEVAEACSGIRSISAYTMLSFLFAYLLRNKKYGSIIIIMAIPLAIIVNIIRVTGTGVLAHFFGGDVARGFLHEFSGMVVFLAGFLIMAFLYKVFTKKEQI